MAKSWKVTLNHEVLPSMREGAARGLNIFAALVHQRAVDRAPKDEGHLRRSAAVVAATPDHLEAKVVFDTPYAARQHEETSWRHKDGQAKYLESAMNDSAEEGKQIIANSIKESLQ